MRKGLLLLPALLLCFAAPAAAKQTRIAVASSTVAQMDSYPAVGRLEMRLEGAGSKIEGFCSGTLISSRYVLTAAHCVSENLSLGQEAIDEMEPRVKFLNKQGAPAVEVSRVVFYGPYAFYDDFSGLDIALLELKRDAPITPMELGSLPAGGGQPTRVLGYGEYSKKNPRMSNQLRYGTSVTAANPNNCVSRSGGQIKVHDYQICNVVDVPKGYISEGCPGDSGGPLLGPDGKVVGVTSFSQYLNCEVKPGKRSGVYARVSSGIDWIQRQTGLSLMGRPAVEQNLTAPSGAEARVVSISKRRVLAAVEADGEDWNGFMSIYVFKFTSRSFGMTTAQALISPGDSYIQVDLPRSFRSSRVRRIEASASARVWNPLDNGVTVFSSPRSVRP